MHLKQTLSLSHLALSLTFAIGCHHGWGFLECALQLLVCILLHSLCVLQLLDKLHLKLLHLHYFLFFLISQVVFIVDAVIMVSLDIRDASLTIFFNFHWGEAFLLVHNLILHAIFLLDLKVLELFLLFVLLLLDLGLLGFFTFRLKDSLLHFTLFVSPVLIDRIILRSYETLMLVLNLVVVDFLKTKIEQS